jgi:hypothetical protein
MDSLDDRQSNSSWMMESRARSCPRPVYNTQYFDSQIICLSAILMISVASTTDTSPIMAHTKDEESSDQDRQEGQRTSNMSKTKQDNNDEGKH